MCAANMIPSHGSVIKGTILAVRFGPRIQPLRSGCRSDARKTLNLQSEPPDNWPMPFGTVWLKRVACISNRASSPIRYAQAAIK
jgi:hypothetical protein